MQVGAIILQAKTLNVGKYVIKLITRIPIDSVYGEGIIIKYSAPSHYFYLHVRYTEINVIMTLCVCKRQRAKFYAAASSDVRDNAQS